MALSFMMFSFAHLQFHLKLSLPASEGGVYVSCEVRTIKLTNSRKESNLAIFQIYPLDQEYYIPSIAKEYFIFKAIPVVS